MKNLKSVLLVACVTIISIGPGQGQNYKVPKIDAFGKITDHNGKLVGSITSEGIITDESGAKVGHVEGDGTLVDEKTGMKLGKAEKNGNFIWHFNKSKNEEWSTSAPMNGTCLVKNKEGKVVAEVHENYKQFGACAIHCLSNKMEHNKVLDESSHTAFVCPMHSDVKSEKEGKCSKCGMALVKEKE